MKCKTIQDIILTDYLDEQIGNAQKQEIETHLSACPLCRKFETAARQTVIEPFKTAKRKETPAGVWDSIKKNIQEEKEMVARNPMTAVFEKLNAFVPVSKPAFMLTSSIFVLVIGILFVFYSSKNNTKHFFLSFAIW